MMTLFLFALLAGIVTALSPCVLPILPAILAGGASGNKFRSFGIVSGILLSFSFFTLALTAIVQSTGISADYLRVLAIICIGFFGFTLLFPALSDLFSRYTNGIANFGNAVASKSARYTGFLSGFILGGSLGLVWTPCAGPILAAVTTLALTQTVTLQAVLLILCYSIGAGIPLFIFAIGSQRLIRSSKRLNAYSERIRQAFGIIMIVTAIFMITNLDRRFQTWAVQYLPLFIIDNNVQVSQQLQQTLHPQDTKSITGKPMDISALTNESIVKKLPDLGNAPELPTADSWINSEPLSLASLKGKVVLIDFWTYSCINCIRTLPYVTKWYANYKDKGFVVIGVHTPEFEFEKNRENVLDTTKRFEITYPVAQDNEYAIWQAFHNQFWPAKYLIDRDGKIRYTHFGEGDYNETENAIRSLLEEPALPTESSSLQLFHSPQTPETYLGYGRAQSYIETQSPFTHDESADFQFSGTPATDEVGVTGHWIMGKEKITASGSDSHLVLHFEAGKVHLVLSGKSTVPLVITLDNHPLEKTNYSEDYNQKEQLIVDQDREYTIVDLHGQPGNHLLDLLIPPNISAYAFTFGD